MNRGYLRTVDKVRNRLMLLTIVASVCAGLCLAWGLDSVRDRNDDIERMTRSVTDIKAELTDLHARNRALRGEVVSLTVQNLQLQEEVEALDDDLRSQSGEVGSPRLLEVNHKLWGASDTRACLARACDSYGVKGDEKKWVVSTGTRVAERESTHRPSARNGQYLGLFQFGRSWGSRANRLDPEWSCFRFVRVYKAGGKRAIRRHWRATV